MIRPIRPVQAYWSVFGLLALFLLVPRALAQDADADAADDPSPYSDAELVSESTAIVPGSTFTVALRLAMEEHWHSYWKNPGDSGQETYIEWDLPDGFTAGDIQWPYPERIDAGPLSSYGYSDEVFLLTDITAPADLEVGSVVRLAGAADWLVCAEICLLANADVELTLPVAGEASLDAAGDAVRDSEWADAIAETREKLPVEGTGWGIRATRSSETYALHLTPPDATFDLDGSWFFVDTKGTLDHDAAQPLTTDGRSTVIALQQSAYAQGAAERLSGILVAPEGESWVPGSNARSMRVDVPVEEARAAGLAMADDTGARGPALSVWWALLFAFGGGLLLNLMPCIFPILSIKVLGFARQSGDSPSALRRHGWIFAAGVIVSFWILAGLLLALRAGGESVGWGFQLQSPLFIALMTLLFFAIGLNLLGVFEVGGGLMRMGGAVEYKSAAGVRGTFLSGVLATVVATPCTAPFMGAALGLALTLSAPQALAIFTALGAGMAAPYVALSMSPALLRRLPKPEAWMETFKHVLAFPMFATAVWLIWVFGRQVGNDGVALLLFALLLVGVAGWAWERLNTRTLAGVAAVGAIVMCVTGAGMEQPVAGSAGEATGESADGWQPYSTSEAERLVAEGRPVFVDFTAAWCLTCQVNKRTTLRSDAVMAAFRKHGVVPMTADWTNQDPEITRALESLGRSGVPVYALFKGDGSAPMLLPEILTRDLVLDALAELPSELSSL